MPGGVQVLASFTLPGGVLSPLPPMPTAAVSGGGVGVGGIAGRDRPGTASGLARTAMRARDGTSTVQRDGPAPRGHELAGRQQQRLAVYCGVAVVHRLLTRIVDVVVHRDSPRVGVDGGGGGGAGPSGGGSGGGDQHRGSVSDASKRSAPASSDQHRGSVSDGGVAAGGISGRRSAELTRASVGGVSEGVEEVKDGDAVNTTAGKSAFSAGDRSRRLPPLPTHKLSVGSAAAAGVTAPGDSGGGGDAGRRISASPLDGNRSSNHANAAMPASNSSSNNNSNNSSSSSGGAGVTDSVSHHAGDASFASTTLSAHSTISARSGPAVSHAPDGDLDGSSGGYGIAAVTATAADAHVQLQWDAQTVADALVDCLHGVYDSVAAPLSLYVLPDITQQQWKFYQPFFKAKRITYGLQV